MPHQELNEAVNEGNVDRIRELLPSLREAATSWLSESLLRASYENRAEAVRALLEVSASPLATDGLGQTPLHWAARQGHEAVARLLVDRGAPVRAQNQDGLTPLHIAAETNAGAIVQLLLGHGADPAVLSNDKRTCLHAAAEHGCVLALAVLLEARAEEISGPGGALESENERGETPLARAAIRGQAAVAQLLLRGKADPGHRNLWGQSPLQLAALGGHVGVAAVLLDAGADLNCRAQDGTTALHTAADRGNPQVVELLLSNNATVALKASGGRTPLHAAAEKGSLEAAEALLAHGADPNALTDEARTPLSFAASRGHVLVVQKLLEQKADIKAVDNMQQTALHAAAVTGRVEVGEVLLERRAKLEQKDAAGRTPLALAIANRQEGMMRLLLKRGACLPEEVAHVEEMQPLLRRVEADVLQEQLREAEESKGGAKIQAAEQEFEDIRLKLLALATVAAAAQAAPVIHNAERELADAMEMAKSRKEAAATMTEQVKVLKTKLAEVNAEVSEKSRLLTNTKKAMQAFKDAKSRKHDELAALKREVMEAEGLLKTSLAKKAPLEAQTLEAQTKVKALEETLGALNEDADAALAELKRIRDELARWNAAKEEAAELHWKAHALLHRGAPASPTGRH